MKNEAFIKLHLSIILAGFTGLFGKLISLNEGLLVCYRMLITALLLCPILYFSGKLAPLSTRKKLKVGATGIILGLHWVFFYGSIKAANVSIGVVCFSLVGFFTAILEPLVFRRRVSVRELIYSIITVMGILLIFHFDTRYRAGIILGIISTALAALFTIINKKVSSQHPSGTILLHEMAGGFTGLVCMLPAYLYFFPVDSVLPGFVNFGWLLVMSLFCTIGLYLLQIQALKSISAFTLNLSYNLEPVYSIILAMLLFGEARELNWPFYAGISLIIVSVLLQTRFILKSSRKPSPS